MGSRGCVIGRDPKRCSVVFDGPLVSARQCVVKVLPAGGYELQDLSRNGTLLNGAPLGADAREVGLSDGDVIEFFADQQRLVRLRLGIAAVAGEGHAPIPFILTGEQDFLEEVLVVAQQPAHSMPTCIDVDGDSLEVVCPGRSDGGTPAVAAIDLEPTSVLIDLEMGGTTTPMMSQVVCDAVSPAMPDSASTEDLPQEVCAGRPLVSVFDALREVDASKSPAALQLVARPCASVKRALAEIEQSLATAPPTKILRRGISSSGALSDEMPVTEQPCIPSSLE